MLRRRRSESKATGHPAARGWGPFSGGQLTAIILGLTLAISFPIGAWAVSGTTVFVTDKATGKSAEVNSSRQLSIFSSGALTARPTSPASSYQTRWNFVSNSQPCTSITAPVPAGKALIVMSITVNVLVESVPGPITVNVIPAKAGSPCTQLVPSGSVDITSLPGVSTSETIPFPQGLPIKAGHVVGMVAFGSSGVVTVAASVKGYLVSSSLCTVTAPPTGCW